MFRRTTALLAALTVTALASASRHADAVQLYYERAVMVSADARCHLFPADLASSLQAAMAQAHGAALRLRRGRYDPGRRRPAGSEPRWSGRVQFERYRDGRHPRPLRLRWLQQAAEDGLSGRYRRLAGRAILAAAQCRLEAVASRAHERRWRRHAGTGRARRAERALGRGELRRRPRALHGAAGGARPLAGAAAVPERHPRDLGSPAAGLADAAELGDDRFPA